MSSDYPQMFAGLFRRLDCRDRLSLAFYALEVLAFRAFKWRIRDSFSIHLDGMEYSVKTNTGDLGCIYVINCQHIYEVVPGFLVKEGETCLDVGANIGCVSLSWARSNKSGMIVAVEPHPATFARLVKNLELNRATNVKLVHAAASRQSGTVALEVDDDSSMAHTVGSDMPSLKQFRIVEVPAYALDDLVREYQLTAVHLLKIDVEGYEMECLNGAVETLGITDRVIVEYHSERLRQECRRLLAEGSFVLEEYGGSIFAHKTQG